MNQDEIIKLIKDIFKCFLKESPSMWWKCSEGEGCKLVIKDSTIPESRLDCIKSVVEKHKLKYLWTTDKSERVLVIYTPRKD